MGKRQKRIFRHQIISQQAVLLGTEACVITKDGRTLRGCISSLENEKVCVKDMRQILQEFLLTDVVELVLDYEADY